MTFPIKDLVQEGHSAASVNESSPELFYDERSLSLSGGDCFYCQRGGIARLLTTHGNEAEFPFILGKLR